MGKQRFEHCYKTCRYFHEVDSSILKMETEGWEMFAVTETDAFTLFFKRPFKK